MKDFIETLDYSAQQLKDLLSEKYASEEAL